MINGNSYEVLNVREGEREYSASSYAIPYNAAIRFELHISRIFGVENILFSLRSDGYSDREISTSIPMTWGELEGGRDVYTADVDFSEFGLSDGELLFYSYIAETFYGRRYVVYDGCGDIAVNADETYRQLLLVNEKYPIKDYPRGIIYHIFVDRFCRSGKCGIKPDSVLIEDWYGGIPEFPEKPGDFLKNNSVFGGDLYGVASKLDYIKSLGTDIIYLSPVFEAYSNHKYDTGDYTRVDSAFGGDEALEFLIAEARKRNISIILDGVFNHTGDDSVYFNRYGKYAGVGAYRSKNSPYFDWYDFKKFPDDYSCWWGIKILPRVNCDNASYRDFICGSNGVVEKWMRKGIKGFRLDVADELSDDFIAALKEKENAENPKSLLYGEVWENASNKVAYSTRRKYFRGNELDSVMNYPCRKAIIEYLKNGDYKNFTVLLNDVYCTYPEKSKRLLMNFLGTHDTERIITLLGGDSPEGKSNLELSRMRMNGEQRQKGICLLKQAFAILFSLPGIPCVFYGDEVGMEGYNDPFNRRPFPWGKEDAELLLFVSKLSLLRKNIKAFTEGEFAVDFASSEVLVLRNGDADGVLTVVNRGNREVHIYSDSVFSSAEGEYDSGVILPHSHCILLYSGNAPEFEIV